MITVKRAYLELERAGVIVTQAGRGSYVSANSDLSLQLKHQEFEQQLSATIELARQLQLSDEQIIDSVTQQLVSDKPSDQRTKAGEK